jgi:hypothetical protein
VVEPQQQPQPQPAASSSQQSQQEPAAAAAESKSKAGSSSSAFTEESGSKGQKRGAVPSGEGTVKQRRPFTQSKPAWLVNAMRQLLTMIHMALVPIIQRCIPQEARQNGMLPKKATTAGEKTFVTHHMVKSKLAQYLSVYGAINDKYQTFEQNKVEAVIGAFLNCHNEWKFWYDPLKDRGIDEEKWLTVEDWHSVVRLVGQKWNLGELPDLHWSEDGPTGAPAPAEKQLLMRTDTGPYNIPLSEQPPPTVVDTWHDDDWDWVCMEDMKTANDMRDSEVKGK